MPHDNPPETVLTHIAALRTIMQEVGFDYHAAKLEEPEKSDALKQLYDRVRRIWELWAKEVTSRYFAQKMPNLVKQIPYADAVDGMSKQHALAVLAEEIHDAQALVEALSKQGICYPQLDAAFDGFARYQKEPLAYHQQLQAHAADAEACLLEMQHELNGA